MVRSRSSSSSSSSWGPWRVLHPAYYLKRPRRLGILFVVFVLAYFAFWDRQTLVREHEAEISKLKEELNRLQDQLRKAEDRSVKPDEHFTSDKMIDKSIVKIDSINNERREKVKEAMLHAWNSYEKYAWGQDELQPQSKNGVNSFGGLGATLVDSLDTLYIMGLEDEFQKAREWVANTLDFNKDYEASVFETTIRVVGGLLSAYDLSGDGVFLEKAKDIADRLLPAWDTSSGIPYNRINLARGQAHNPGWTRGDSILADSGTEQLEFIALSQRTGDPKYQQKAENVIRQLQKTFPNDGLLPIYIILTQDLHRIRPSHLVPWATGTTTSPDFNHEQVLFYINPYSFYEYLLKAWIQGNKTEPVKHYRKMWETSMEGLLSLVRRTTPSSFTYICEKNGVSLSDKMDELACFVPGMLALGSFGYGSEKGEKILSLAEELAWTCYNFYQSTPTKLAGENYFFHSGQDMTVGTSWNILRPETNSRIESGYVGLKDVNTGAKDNMMQSFFLAETLKYLYLLFSPPSLISLDEWVFNTEAHPLRIVPRNDKAEAVSRGADANPITKAPVRPFGRKQGRSEHH
uniref:alpha-1,2-Mannosidase n=1 Tax=Ananas comosus var. bracteatus TaxID=296719 RepID=A0A6V7NXR9_ANACO|nr:unnamed protein product [Ananas comosus var. bracteatus]